MKWFGVRQAVASNCGMSSLIVQFSKGKVPQAPATCEVLVAQLLLRSMFAFFSSFKLAYSVFCCWYFIRQGDW